MSLINVGKMFEEAILSEADRLDRAIKRADETHNAGLINEVRAFLMQYEDGLIDPSELRLHLIDLADRLRT